MKIPNYARTVSGSYVSLARIVSEDSQPRLRGVTAPYKSSKDS